jgi:hypothetical protein
VGEDSGGESVRLLLNSTGVDLLGDSLKLGLVGVNAFYGGDLIFEISYLHHIKIRKLKVSEAIGIEAMLEGIVVVGTPLLE